MLARVKAAWKAFKHPIFADQVNEIAARLDKVDRRERERIMERTAETLSIEAKALLDNPILINAMRDTEKTVIELIRSTPIADTDTQQSAVLFLQVRDLFENCIYNHIEAFEANQINEAAKAKYQAQFKNDVIELRQKK